MPTDTRPRYPYRLPDGRIVKVIHDYNEQPKAEITYDIGGGQVVIAKLDLAERAFERAENDGSWDR